MSADVTGLHLSDDLLFTSRVATTAGAAGLHVRTARTPASLLSEAGVHRPRCVLLDLQNAGGDIAAILCSLQALEPRPLVVGYGSHVATATLKRAREAGCDVVLPRSKFAEELATSLPRWLSGVA